MKWERLALPKYLGGWDIKNIKFFNMALFLRYLWSGVFYDGLWSMALKDRYMKSILYLSGFTSLRNLQLVLLTHGMVSLVFSIGLIDG